MISRRLPSRHFPHLVNLAAGLCRHCRKLHIPRNLTICIINMLIGNISLFNSQYFNYNLTRRFRFLPKSSSGVNWGRTLRGDIITQNKQQDFWKAHLLFIISWRVICMQHGQPASWNSKPMSLLNLLLSGVFCMCRASLIFNSQFLLALSTTLTASHFMGWCCCQECSAMAETLSSPLLQASQCSFNKPMLNMFGNSSSPLNGKR